MGLAEDWKLGSRNRGGMWGLDRSAFSPLQGLAALGNVVAETLFLLIWLNWKHVCK